MRRTAYTDRIAMVDRGIPPAFWRRSDVSVSLLGAAPNGIANRFYGRISGILRRESDRPPLRPGQIQPPRVPLFPAIAGGNASEFIHAAQPSFLHDSRKIGLDRAHANT